MRAAGNPLARTILAGCLLAIATLAGCASSGRAIDTGPFGGAGAFGLNCGWVHPGGVLGYGTEEFQNKSASSAVIEKVALVAPRQLRVLAAYAVPVTGTIIYGIQIGNPPQDMPPGENWQRRQRAISAVIPHSAGHDATNLVLVLKPVGSKPGSATGVDVYYRVAQREYLLRTAMQILVMTGRRCPSDLQRYIRR